MDFDFSIPPSLSDWDFSDVNSFQLIETYRVKSIALTKIYRYLMINIYMIVQRYNCFFYSSLQNNSQNKF